MSLVDSSSHGDMIPGVHLGPPHWSKTVGSLVSRVVVPAWVFAGATFKLFERDPLLLPPPVISVVRELGSALGADLPTFLMFSMRAMIGVEFAAVAVMVLFPRLSRIVAAAILSLFLVILAAVLWQGYQKGGMQGMLSDCGCFGSKGPPAPVIFLIDAGLLAAVLAFRVPLSAHWIKIQNRMAAITAAVALAGIAVAFAVPPRGMATPPASADSGGSDPAAVAGPWSMPAPPPEPFYFDKFENWVGKPFAGQPLARQIVRPVPAGIDQGRWHVVLYRADCEVCHELLETYFSGELETPVLAIEIPDTDPAGAMEMPCVHCTLASFPKGPSYVITTPVLLTMVDGTVVCACEDVNDEAKLAECLDAR